MGQVFLVVLPILLTLPNGFARPATLHNLTSHALQDYFTPQLEEN